MEALTSSSSKLLAESCRSRAVSSSRSAILRRRYPEICFFPLSHQTLNCVRLSNPISLRFNSVQSISSESKVEVAAAEDLIQATNQSKAVHVKFQLQKECLFGEQFLLVGDDSILGIWDPANAIPLEWTDGHIWTAQLDIPPGKSIQFKFILKGATGEVVWQPGLDRILQTWETDKTIVISEDWENAEIQKIMEEEPMANANTRLFVEENISSPGEEPMADISKESIVADNITFPKQEEITADPMNATENFSYLNEEARIDSNNELIIAETKTCSEELSADPKEASVVGDYIVVRSNGTSITENKLKNDYNLVDHEAQPVLVPGLKPMPTSTIFEPSKAESTDVFVTSVKDEEAENPDVPEKTEREEPIVNQHHEGKSVAMFDDGTKVESSVNGLGETRLGNEQEQHHYQTADDDFWENDIQWGRKTLRRLLANLGFL